MSSRLLATANEWLKDSAKRDLDVFALDTDLTNLTVDPYVGFEMTIAMTSYVLGIYDEPIFLCGLAIEEQLSLIYQMSIKKDPRRRLVRKEKGKIVSLDVTDMTFGLLIEWARNEKIVDSSWGTDADMLQEIKDARDMFAHANRIIAPKIRAKVAAGGFKNLLPRLGTSTPPIGWFQTQQVSLNAIKGAVSVVIRLHKYSLTI